MTDKPASFTNVCLRCIHRRDVSGAERSRCAHPAVSADGLKLIPAMMAAGMRCEVVKVAGIEVRGNPEGITQGWFFWPLNYDPRWLEYCSGFTERVTQADSMR